MDWLAQLLDTSDFPPRWSCGHWTPLHGWTHIAADTATWGAYTAIPLVLAWFAWRRKDIAFPKVTWLFVAFIFACGTVHLVEATLFWWPWYRLSALAKVVTAVVSWATVVAVVKVAPRALNLPGAAHILAIVESTDDAIIGKALDGRITSWNSAAERLYGYSRDEVLGRDISLLAPPDRLDELAEIMRRLRGGHCIEHLETVRRRKDGHLVDVSLTISPIRAHGGQVVGASTIARDVSAEKQAQAELVALTHSLERQAHHDPLTGLANRRGMERALTRELARAVRAGTRVVAVMIDLDDFKSVNDSLGHAAGDVVLVSAAQRMAGCLRPEDVLARVGGDEFLLLLPDTRPAEGRQVAERLRLAIADSPVSTGGHPVELTASLALALVPEGVLSIEEVLSLTHAALARGKREGKNRVVVPGDPDPPARPGTRAGAGADVRKHVLRPESLTVMQQPIRSLGTGRVTAHELLVRGPAGPYEQPYDLFRLSMERNDLTSTDLLCLRTCVQRSVALPDHGRLHVNLFPSTLLDTPADRLIDLFARHGGPDRFCVELSEQQFLGDPSSLRSPVVELQGAGVQVGLDDVGFGRSSLEALIVLEPDVVKIDRTFVHGVSSDVAHLRRLERLVHTARNLCPTLVAEGLEAEDDRRALQELGIEQAQGFLLGRPVAVPAPA